MKNKRGENKIKLTKEGKKGETKYHFTIKNEKFEECLDIFANVFISPLMSENAISREINAVDSEFTNNFLQNSRRFLLPPSPLFISFYLSLLFI